MKIILFVMVDIVEGMEVDFGDVLSRLTKTNARRSSPFLPVDMKVRYRREVGRESQIP